MKLPRKKLGQVTKNKTHQIPRPQEIWKPAENPELLQDAIAFCLGVAGRLATMRCKATTVKGFQCLNEAVIDGMCQRHYNARHNAPIQWIRRQCYYCYYFAGEYNARTNEKVVCAPHPYGPPDFDCPDFKKPRYPQ